MVSHKGAGRGVTVALASVAVFCGLAHAATDEPHWQPDQATIADMETSIRQQMRDAHLRDLDDYARNYWGVTVAGERVIVGQVIYWRTRDRVEPPAGVVIGTEPDRRFMMSDGSCNNIRVSYDVAHHVFRQLGCDGWGGLTPPRKAPP